MEFFLLLIHSIVAIFIFFYRFIFNSEFIPLQMLIFILYLIAIVMPVIFKNIRLKLVLHFFYALGLIGMIVYEPFIALLLPFHLARTASLLKQKTYYLLAFILIPVLFVSDKPLYFFTGLLCWLVSNYLIQKQESLFKSEKKIDNLEKENRYLTHELALIKEWEREKEYYIKLDERKKISQKLHDEIGHSLSGSIIQLQAISTILQDEPVKAAQMIRNVQEVLSQGMMSIRRDLQTLKPEDEKWGLQKLKSELIDFEKNTGISTTVTISGTTAEITQKQWLTIHSNLKEALTNVMKHSHADEVSFQITILNKLVKVAINDNGWGRKDIVPGMGLSGMEERTQDAGGTLILDGSKGFSIVMIFKKEA